MWRSLALSLERSIPNLRSKLDAMRDAQLTSGDRRSPFRPAPTPPARSRPCTTICRTPKSSSTRRRTKREKRPPTAPSACPRGSSRDALRRTSSSSSRFDANLVGNKPCSCACKGSHTSTHAACLIFWARHQPSYLIRSLPLKTFSTSTRTGWPITQIWLFRRLTDVVGCLQAPRVVLLSPVRKNDSFYPIFFEGSRATFGPKITNKLCGRFYFSSEGSGRAKAGYE